MKIIPAKSKLNKWLNTKIQESPIKGIPLSVLSRHDLIYRFIEDNK